MHANFNTPSFPVEKVIKSFKSLFFLIHNCELVNNQNIWKNALFFRKIRF